MSSGSSFVHDIETFERSAFAPWTGFRAGVFIVVPLLLGVISGQLGLLYSTLGALMVTNVDAPRAGLTPMRILLVACLTIGIAFGLGTLAGTTGALSIAFMGTGVFVALMLGVRRGWPFLGVNTAVAFAVGAGLPGATVPDAWVRLVFAILGGFWSLSGVALERFVRSRRAPRNVASAEAQPHAPVAPMGWRNLLKSETSKRSAITAVTCAIGFAIGFTLGLPRDFWVVATIILAMRPTAGGTATTTTMIVLGTAVGACLGAGITLEISNAYELWVFLLVFAVALNSTRGINLGLTQGLIAPFIIILLNIIYPGEWFLAEVRILDVVIGGALSVGVAYLLAARWWNRSPSSSRLAGQNPTRRKGMKSPIDAQTGYASSPWSASSRAVWSPLSAPPRGCPASRSEP